MISGIVPIDKPAGFTSFDVVAKCRRIFNTKRIGHSGTLDPMATGVLPVFIGGATKAIDILPDGGKRYSAEFELGRSTDTQDRTGETVATSDVRVTRETVEEALGGFMGKISQLPPMYSAVRVGGKRLYDLARAGKAVERTPRTIEIFDLKLTDFDEEKQCGALDISCSKGTYIRTLINDLGERLGTLGTMTELRRTYSQGFEISHCVTLEDLADASEAGRLGELIIPVEKCFEAFPIIQLDEAQEKRYKNGAPLDPRRVMGVGRDGLYRAYGVSFLGIAEVKGGRLRSLKHFWETV